MGSFWDLIDGEIGSANNTEEKINNGSIQMEIQNMFKALWECRNCGRLFIEAENGGELVFYLPDSKTYLGVLNKKE